MNLETRLANISRRDVLKNWSESKRTLIERFSYNAKDFSDFAHHCV